MSYAFYLGDSVQGLRGMKADSVDLTVTSPPYGKIRDFGGHDFTWEVFSELADELCRVTKLGGIVC